MIFKWVFKSAAAILLVTNTWNIVMGVFDMAQSVVAQASGSFLRMPPLIFPLSLRTWNPG